MRARALLQNKSFWCFVSIVIVIIFARIGYWYVGSKEGPTCKPRATQAKVEIYSRFTCIFCRRAKELLRSKSIEFVEYDITNCPNHWEDMLERSGNRRTVPQIFIHGIHIGGFDDLNTLNEAGKLDQLLNTIK